jgi:hypothetical protein
MLVRSVSTRFILSFIRRFIVHMGGHWHVPVSKGHSSGITFLDDLIVGGETAPLFAFEDGFRRRRTGPSQTQDWSMLSLQPSTLAQSASLLQGTAGAPTLARATTKKTTMVILIGNVMVLLLLLLLLGVSCVVLWLRSQRVYVRWFKTVKKVQKLRWQFDDDARSFFLPWNCFHLLSSRFKKVDISLKTMCSSIDIRFSVVKDKMVFCIENVCVNALRTAWFPPKVYISTIRNSFLCMIWWSSFSVDCESP